MTIVDRAKALVFRGVQGVRHGLRGPKVAINVMPRRAPWGGGNQFAEQFANHLGANGFRAVFALADDVSAVVLMDPRPGGATSFKLAELKAFKRAHPQVPVIHRVNECDKRKGTDDVDEALRLGNAVADYTVFISHWLRDYFAERWFDAERPHEVIQNGADSKVFTPGPAWDGQGEFRLVTHHWSDNWMKGFAVYRTVDTLIAEGKLPGVALSVVGRWPAEIQWRAAKLHGPTRGRELADILRGHHAYLTASLWEPCGMHHVEGAQCGLPLLYHRDGGGIVEFGERYGLGFADDPGAAILKARDDYAALRAKVLADPPSGAAMVGAYLDVVRRVLGHG